MPPCVAYFCTNSSTEGIKMYCFPKDKEVQNYWIKNMK